MKVPTVVVEAALDREYIKAWQDAEDETRSVKKRQAAKAMVAEIVRAAERRMEARHGPADSRGDRGGDRRGRAGGRGTLAGE